MATVSHSRTKPEHRFPNRAAISNGLKRPIKVTQTPCSTSSGGPCSQYYATTRVSIACFTAWVFPPTARPRKAPPLDTLPIIQPIAVLIDFLGITFGVPVLNRRNFLKAGVTAGVGVVPLTSALNRLEVMPTSSAEQTTTHNTDGSSVELVSLPRRLPPLD